MSDYVDTFIEAWARRLATESVLGYEQARHVSALALASGMTYDVLEQLVAIASWGFSSSARTAAITDDLIATLAEGDAK